MFDACHPVAWSNALGCAKTILEGILDEDLGEGGLGSKLARKLRFARAVLKAADLPGLVASLGLAVGSNVFSQHTDAEFANVPKPAGGGQQGPRGHRQLPVARRCLLAPRRGLSGPHLRHAAQIPPGGSYIARNPGTHRAVLVQSGGTVKNIGSGGVFNCLASTMFVFDIPGQPALTGSTSGEATCGDAGPVTWDFRPVRDGGNIPDNVILRERPEDAGANGIASWLINSRGEIQTIPDGGTYLCLAYANPVIWNVPYGNVPFVVGILWWRPVGHEPASCG